MPLQVIHSIRGLSLSLQSIAIFWEERFKSFKSFPFLSHRHQDLCRGTTAEGSGFYYRTAWYVAKTLNYI